MKTKILILTSYFCGGIDLINYFIKSILKKKDIELIICIPKKNFISETKKITFPIFQVLKSLINLDFKRGFYWKFHKGANQVEKFVWENLKDTNYKISYVDFINEKKIINTIKPDVVFPVLEPFDINTNIGYIFDFQHEYYPKNFSKKHVVLRRREIDKLSKLNYFIVNSHETKKDLLKFHPKFKRKRKKVKVVPFSPFIQKKYLLGNTVISKVYNFKKKFFIVCNQFWMHKNHLHVLNLFEKYIENKGENNLIFTGDLNYERYKGYLNKLFKKLEDINLKNRVFFTGDIKKEEQIYLLKKSSALIQPSLFEGGPGAGGVTEATTFGVPIIANNISINKEIKYSNLKFYRNDKEFIKLLFKFEKKKKKIFHTKKIVSKLSKDLKKLFFFL